MFSPYLPLVTILSTQTFSLPCSFSFHTEVMKFWKIVATWQVNEISSNCFSNKWESKSSKAGEFTVLLSITPKIFFFLGCTCTSRQRLPRACIYLPTYLSPHKSHPVSKPTQLKCEQLLSIYKNKYTSIGSNVACCMNLYTSHLMAIKKLRRERLQGFTMPIIRESILPFCLPETTNIAGIVQFALCSGCRCSFYWTLYTDIYASIAAEYGHKATV